MRVVHYLNQFFGGAGGEERAGMGLEVREGAVGPGKLFEQAMGGEARIVRTLVCGDNYAVEEQESMLASALAAILEAGAELLVAGPCFQAGRYGIAAGAVCAAAQERFGIPVVCAMSSENPGAELYREKLYIVDSGTSAARMRDVMARMAGLARKLVAKAEIGLPAEDGYLPRGFIRDRFVEQTAGQRLVAMALAKARGKPYEPEMPPPAFTPIPKPPPVKDLSRARIMVITDGGLVPRGNPDHIESSAATRWGRYSIEGVADLRGEDYEISHGGYDPQFVRQDPDRLVPVDALRELEREGVIGKLHDEFFSTSGLANPLSNTRRIGREMAETIRLLDVDAVLLTST
ncbi:MAG TPA: glycine/betaine/sarcosine/D-proline family reductase selenoprotein B [candidate division Zixibacteria bacterium]|nr:glycine/betaine/sarcosine/D-proline family reductase selenoprotein B [candidate division Zixibacteria bacterium]